MNGLGCVLPPRWVRFRRCGVGCVIAWLAAGAAGAAEPLELAVQAAYLARFPFYVKWPAGAFATAASPIVLCVVGDDPFGRMLDEAAAAQPVRGRRLVVRRLPSLARDSGCHIVYLHGNVRADALAGRGVLVVTATPRGEGMVNFVLEDNRVRFTVDDDAATRNGLTISSRLLGVALSVKSKDAH